MRATARSWSSSRTKRDWSDPSRDITNAVCDLLSRLKVDLVLVDEIHNLNLATRTGAEASDQLKYLAERIPATFIYAGINVEGSGLFAGTRGQQIAGRFGLIACQSFAYGTASQRQEWQALIATLEQSLRLHRHTPGRLLRLDAYLHERTDEVSRCHRVVLPSLDETQVQWGAGTSTPVRRRPITIRAPADPWAPPI